MQGIDVAILKGCLKQERKAEFALYRYCFALLMPICYRYTKQEDDAADLLNKGFLKIVLSLKTFDSSRPFDAWAKTIMVRVIIDEFRAGKNYRNMVQQTDMELLREDTHPWDSNEAEERLSAAEVHRYINRLPEASKMVLNLFVFEGLSHKEIAAQMNISENTSKWHLSNARILLKKMMAGVLKGIKLLVL